MNVDLLHPADQELLHGLTQKLSVTARPGRAAQTRMAPPLRGDYAEPAQDARRAAVLVLLYPIGNRLQLLYIQRTSPKRDRHAGQIGFPGGSVEADDTDAIDTALREAAEEVGADRAAVTILGELTPLFIPVSNFLVDVVVGYTPSRPDFVLQESEVARIIELPLTDFLTEGARRVGPRQLASGLSLPNVPYWAVAGEEIWGATAMMTAELIALLREA